ncbi:MAG: ser/thr kinase [Monoraphidium minutum]|nr:MAG: ser/thr kinase [Monoraphidium minutum]
MEFERYQELRELGKGTFGSVYLAKDVATGELVAIKRMARSEHNRHLHAAEVLNHSRLHHPHVVGFREVLLSRRGVSLVMDYAPGGSLLEFVQRRRRLREPLARWFFQQLLVGVDYCHRMGVANRDIKLDNLLLQPIDGMSQPLLMICDFGYSKACACGCRSGGGGGGGKGCWSERDSRVGTLHYAAPEVLQSGGYDARKADVWSCGVVLYAMLAGSFPFEAPPPGAPREELARGAAALLARLRGGPRPAAPRALGLSRECAHLLQRMLDPDPAARISVAEILQDPWFLTSMPAKALAMNDHYVTLRPSRRQPQSEVVAAAEELRHGGDSDDDSLDQLLLD